MKKAFNKKYLTPILFAIIVLGIVIFAVKALSSPDKGGSNQTSSGDNKGPVQTVTGAQLTQLNSGHAEGPANAKVTLVEFGDYQCPACGNAFPILKDQIIPQFMPSGQFRFVFKNFPLAQPYINQTVHPNAIVGAQAAEAAAAQGKFWEMHDLLYSKQDDWTNDSDPVKKFGQYASQLGLDANRLVSDVRANKYNNVISTDAKLATKLNAPGTPTFYVNGHYVDTSTNGLQAVSDAINAALQK